LGGQGGDTGEQHNDYCGNETSGFEHTVLMGTIIFPYRGSGGDCAASDRCDQQLHCCNNSEKRLHKIVLIQSRVQMRPEQ